MSVFAGAAVVDGQACGAAALKVLVVDDHADGAEALGMLIEMYGHDVSLAFDGQQALDRVLSWQPDLVLMDLSLPVLDGCEATRRVFAHAASHPDFVAPMMVALSGFNADADQVRTAEAGFGQHLVKPLPPAALQALLAQAAAIRSSTPPIAA